MRPPPYLEPLLRVLRRPANAAGLDDGEWDRLLRTARAARLHGVLAHRLQRAAIDSLPVAVTAQLAAARTGPEVEVLGPASAPMERRAGLYRAQLLLHAASHSPLQRLLARWLPAVEELPEARRVRWSIDVDPLELF